MNWTEACQVENINKMLIKLYWREYIAHEGIWNAKQQTEAVVFKAIYQISIQPYDVQV